MRKTFLVLFLATCLVLTALAGCKKQTPEESQQAVEKLIQAFNAQDTDALMDTLADTFVLNMMWEVDLQMTTPEEIRQNLAHLFARKLAFDSYAVTSADGRTVNVTADFLEFVTRDIYQISFPSTHTFTVEDGRVTKWVYKQALEEKEYRARMTSGTAGLSYRIEGVRVFVNSVEYGYPGREAGVRVDDEVMAINGMPVSEMNVDGYEHHFRASGEPGDVITLTLLRRGVNTHEIELELVSIDTYAQARK